MYSFIWNVSVQFGAAFFTLYMLQVLGFPVWLTTAINVSGTVASVYAIRLWGRLADKYGNIPVLTFCTILKAIFPLTFIVVGTPVTAFGRAATIAYMFLAFMTNAANSGMGIGTMNLSLRLIPPGEQTPYLATYRMFSSVVAAFSAAIGGVIADGLLNQGWSQRWSISLLFVISGLGRFTAAWYLRKRVKEPGAVSLGRVWKAMRRVPGVLPSRNTSAMARFWGKPIYSGFIMVRIRLGRLLLGNWGGTQNETR